jgi:hypothetical protein
MLDRDLATLYGVTTGNLNKAVKRNLDRIPDDFMFQLTKDEAESLRFQSGSIKRGQHSKYLPYVFLTGHFDALGDAQLTGCCRYQHSHHGSICSSKQQLLVYSVADAVGTTVLSNSEGVPS